MPGMSIFLGEAGGGEVFLSGESIQCKVNWAISAPRAACSAQRSTS